MDVVYATPETFLEKMMEVRQKLERIERGELCNSEYHKSSCEFTAPNATKCQRCLFAKFMKRE